MSPLMDRTAAFHRLLADTHGRPPPATPGDPPRRRSGGDGDPPPSRLLVAPLSPPSPWITDAARLASDLRAASRAAAAARPAYADFSAAGMDDAGRDDLDAHLAAVVADGMREVARLSEAALATSAGGAGSSATAAAGVGGWLRSTLAVGEVAYRLGITALLSESLVSLEAETAALRGLRVAAAASKARGVSVVAAGDAGGDAAIRRRRAAAAAARAEAAAEAQRERVAAAAAAAAAVTRDANRARKGADGVSAAHAAVSDDGWGDANDDGWADEIDGEEGEGDDGDGGWGALGGSGEGGGSPPELACAVAAAMDAAAAEEEAAWSAAHEQVLVAEHASLRSELLDTREAVRSTEAAVAEVAELNALLGARVAEQAAVIEGVLTAAVDASSSLRRGARELRKLEAGEGGWDVTLLFAVAFFVLALCLLWLHWLNR
ncbi:hypothetical protein MMPV_003889 [Pyropia vietnamensis]